MTLTEVVVSAVILGISSQVSLQGWSRTSQAAATSARTDQQVQLLEQREHWPVAVLWPVLPLLMQIAVWILRRSVVFWRGCPRTPSSKRHGVLNLQPMPSGSLSS